MLQATAWSVVEKKGGIRCSHHGAANWAALLNEGAVRASRREEVGKAHLDARARAPILRAGARIAGVKEERGRASLLGAATWLN